MIYNLRCPKDSFALAYMKFWRKKKRKYLEHELQALNNHYENLKDSAPTPEKQDQIK